MVSDSLRRYLRTPAGIVLVLVLLVSLLYSVLIVGQILLWFVVVFLGGTLYVLLRLVELFGRFVTAAERTATAAERLTAAREGAVATPGPDRTGGTGVSDDGTETR